MNHSLKARIGIARLLHVVTFGLIDRSRTTPPSSPSPRPWSPRPRAEARFPNHLTTVA